jgi:hypothetical protein
MLQAKADIASNRVLFDSFNEIIRKSGIAILKLKLTVLTSATHNTIDGF